MKYTRKPYEIDAFQITYENYNDRTKWPTWMQDRWEPMHWYLEKYSICESHVREDGYPRLMLFDGIGLDMIDFGSYIIRDLNNALYILPEADFIGQFCRYESITNCAYPI